MLKIETSNYLPPNSPIIHLKRNTDKKSHEIVYGVRSKQPIDHIPIAEYYYNI